MSIRTITVHGRGYNTTQAEITVVLNNVPIYSGPVWTSASENGELFQFDVTVDDLNSEQTLAITNENWRTTLVKTQSITITPTVGDLIVGQLISPMQSPNDTAFVYDPLNFVWAPPAPSVIEDPTYNTTINDVAVTVNRNSGQEGKWHYQVAQNSTLKFSFDIANRFTTSV